MMIKLILVAFVCMLSSVLAQPPLRCFTPDEYLGRCIPYPSCKHLYELAQKYPNNPRNRLYISLSQCGYFNDQPYVCCKETENSSPPATTEQPFTILNKQIPKPGECGTFYEYRLIGRNDTQLDDYPWLALLGYSKPQNETGFHCGGSLISRRYVLTSGRCIRGKTILSSWKLSYVRLGEWNIDKDEDCDDSYVYEKVCADLPIDVKISEIIPHPQYNPNDRNQFNDIGLLRLERDVEFTDFIKPICLPFDSRLRENLFDTQAFEIAGWGKSEQSSLSNIKLKSLVDGISTDHCNGYYSNDNLQISGNIQICAGKSKQFTCRSDLGGPLMRISDKGSIPYYYVAGIASFDLSRCGLDEKPGIYTRVGNYIDWIQATIRP